MTRPMTEIPFIIMTDSASLTARRPSLIRRTAPQNTSSRFLLVVIVSQTGRLMRPWKWSCKRESPKTG